MADPVLQNDERNKLAGIVSHLPDFTDYGVRGRREFVQAAGLGKFLPVIDWSGSDSVVAGDLVGQLDRHGYLQERPAYHALGQLIAYLLNHPSVGQQDATFMATLVVNYDLVRDPAYVAGLRAKYGIAEVLPPQPERVAGVPPMAAAIAQPAFAPVVQDKSALEQTLNSDDNFLDIYLLLGAVYCAQAVARVEVPEGQPMGTGWLIGPDLLLTNQHVLQSPDYVRAATVRFGFMRDGAGVKVNDGRTFSLVPDFYYDSPAEKLDYALVRLTDQPLKDMMLQGGAQDLSLLELIRLGKHRGYLVAAPRPIFNLQRVNIIQYPGEHPLKVVLTQNRVTADMTSTRVQYRADTKKGSSGSPVLNNFWEVVALHHSGEPYPKEPGPAGSQAGKDDRLGINEGVPMTAILEDFKNRKTLQGYPLYSLLPRS